MESLEQIISLEKEKGKKKRKEEERKKTQWVAEFCGCEVFYLRHFSQKCMQNLTEITLFEIVFWKTNKISRYQASCVTLTTLKFNRVDSPHL